MDQKLVFGSIGSILKYLGILMIFPIGVALWYGERIVISWVIPLAITIFFGVLLERNKGVRKGEMRVRESFAIVALGWLFAPFFCSLPYIFSGTLGPLDAFFESMAAFTTTGSTVMRNLEQVDRSILLWRSFTQWIGGLGVIMLFIAILPTFGIAGSQLFAREFPGPLPERIRPRVQVTARMLWSIYLILTNLEILALLYIAKMPLFDTLCNTFSTMPTGGFSPHPESIGGYLNPKAELIIMVFMFLGGINFILHYSFLRNPRRVLANKEFQFYCFFLIAAGSIIAVDLYLNKFATSLFEAFRYGWFQAVSFMTTTGFTTAKFDTWPHLSKIILLCLMFVGACGGSTGGAIKVIRVYVLLKYIDQRIRKILYPHAIFVVKSGKKPIPEEVLEGIIAFVFTYNLIFVGCSIAMTALGLDILSATSAVATTLGNVGPGFGLVSANFASVHFLGKIILAFCMWVGRLELFTALVLLTPTFWKG